MMIFFLQEKMKSKIVALLILLLLPLGTNAMYLESQAPLREVRWDTVSDAKSKTGLLLGEPVRIRGGFVDGLMAFRWSRKDITSAGAGLIRVREHSADRAVFAYVEVGREEELSEQWRERLALESGKFMDPAMLLSSTTHTTTNTTVHRYASLHLEEFGPKLQHDFPSHLFDMEDIAKDSPDAGTATHIWLGQGRGTTAGLHYDGYHNIYLQLHGVKEFLLFAPEDLGKVRLFPHLSPLARQSSLEWLPVAEDSRVTAQRVTLNPGDMMYVPPFWGHRVTLATDWSVSLSVWSQSSQHVIEEELFALPLPFESSWTWQEKFLVWGSLFAPQVVGQDFIGGGGGGWVSFFRTHLELPYSYGIWANVSSCREGEEEPEPNQFVDFSFVDTNKVRTYATRARELITQARVPDLLTASYLEHSLYSLFGSFQCVANAITLVGRSSVVDKLL